MVTQLSCYETEYDEHMLAAEEMDADNLAAFVRRMRADSPSELLSLALSELPSDVREILANQKFEITLGADSDNDSVVEIKS